ncbi:MAG: hypothetical protein HW415_1665 [Deltaproteobacteria bacterium]|nr:hypothetical protein [Deltaproteobacteria bacterium]
MSDRAVELIKEAVGLSYAERAHVVDELLATLEPEAENEVDEAWAAEVERRGLELSQGTVKPVIWEEVKKKALSMVHEQG